LNNVNQQYFVKGTKCLPISAFFFKREEIKEACVEMLFARTSKCVPSTSR